MMNERTLTPPERLMQHLTGRWIGKAIYVAAELCIADLLARGPRSIQEIAGETRTHPPSLYRLMRALAGVDIFREAEDGRFELTPMAECLQTGAMRSFARLFHSEFEDLAWTRLLDGVRTGRTPFELAHGRPLFRWLETHPRETELLNEANAVKAASSHRAIIDVYDFSGVSRMMDLGGGWGALMTEILEARPHLRGVVAERDDVARGAREWIRSRGLAHRCDVLVCDFFEKVPGGCDALLLSHILHDWPDEACLRILGNCRDALEPGTRLLVVEMLLPPGNEPSMSKLLDLEMMVVTGGIERTEREIAALLEASGFAVARVLKTRASVSLVEAMRV
jgi:cyclopropane fatty-acyl-phospholipid synthase-like methyltransferase